TRKTRPPFLSLWRSSRCPPILAAIGLLWVPPLLGAQTASAPKPPAIAAASVRWLCTGYGCKSYRGLGPYTVDPQRFSCHSCGVLGLLRLAYGLEFPSQIEDAPDWASAD